LTAGRATANCNWSFSFVAAGNNHRWDSAKAFHAVATFASHLALDAFRKRIDPACIDETLAATVTATPPAEGVLDSLSAIGNQRKPRVKRIDRAAARLATAPAHRCNVGRAARRGTFEHWVATGAPKVASRR
jgi:hypothetical protein